MGQLSFGSLAPRSTSVPAKLNVSDHNGTSTLASDDAGSHQSPERIQASLNAACLMPLATMRGPFRFSPTFVTG